MIRLVIFRDPACEPAAVLAGVGNLFVWKNVVLGPQQEELAHLRESISESTGRATSVEYVEKGAQTENASTGPDSLLYAGLAEPDSEEHAGDSDAHACATRKRWHAHKPIYTAGFPMETVLKAIQRVYQVCIVLLLVCVGLSFNHCPRMIVQSCLLFYHRK